MGFCHRSIAVRGDLDIPGRNVSGTLESDIDDGDPRRRAASKFVEGGSVIDQVLPGEVKESENGGKKGRSMLPAILPGSDRFESYTDGSAPIELPRRGRWSRSGDDKTRLGSFAFHVVVCSERVMTAGHEYHRQTGLGFDNRGDLVWVMILEMGSQKKSEHRK